MECGIERVSVADHFVDFFFFLVSFAEIRIPEVQERVADAVNNIVKHFYKPEKEVTPVTYNFFLSVFPPPYSVS